MNKPLTTFVLASVCLPIIGLSPLTQPQVDIVNACEYDQPEWTPSPTPETTPESSATPEPTPTATESASPTPTPPIIIYKEELHQEPPTPTQPSLCPDAVPGDVANIYVDRGIPNDGKLEVRWWEPSGASEVHIMYTDGEPGDWRYALLNTPNDGNEVIGELKNNTHYWFQILGVQGCATGRPSAPFDPIP